jgi:hypothetical protein
MSIYMMELTLAYLAAAVLIGGLLYLAERNHKRGWRKQRDVWGQIEASSSHTSIEPRVELALEHFNDLARLRRSLASENESVRKEQLTPAR